MKSIFKWLVIVSVLCAVGFLINRTVEKDRSNKANKQKRAIMPKIALLSSDSMQFDLFAIENKPLVLIHFNSECDHCQYEAKDVKKNAESFSGANLVFMSSEPLSKIGTFAREYGLANYQNIYFTKIDAENAITAFGSLSIPHVFIYGSDKVLIKEFRGETSAAVIIKHLPSL